MFGQGYNRMALQTGKVVMVLAKAVAQFKLIFPADCDAAQNAEFLIERHNSIDAGAVKRLLDADVQLGYSHGIVADECRKDGETGIRHTIPVITQ